MEWEITLYYDKTRNIMVDEDDNEIIDIYRLISPNTLYLFKTRKKDMLAYGVGGKRIGLIYP